MILSDGRPASAMFGPYNWPHMSIPLRMRPPCPFDLRPDPFATRVTKDPSHVELAWRKWEQDCRDVIDAYVNPGTRGHIIPLPEGATVAKDRMVGEPFPAAVTNARIRLDCEME